MKKIIFDIEGDDLLPRVTKMHCLVAKVVGEPQLYRFLEGDLGWMKLFDGNEIIGHNIISYDLCVLEKLFNYKRNGRITDTLLMSQVSNYMRFYLRGHSLAVWGEHLGFPKGEMSDFSVFTPEMLAYCENDVLLTEKVYTTLAKEYEKAPESTLLFLKNEHKAAQWQAKAQLKGWPMDLPKMLSVLQELEEKLNNAENALLPKLGYKVKYIDKVKDTYPSKSVGRTKEGFYNAAQIRYFGFDPYEALVDEPVVGPFTRVNIEPLQLSSTDDVKTFLFRNGWEPHEWNTKIDETGQRVKTSPKITEESLEFLGGDGKLYAEYSKASARHSILKGWLEKLDSDERLHGDSMIIGTPSMRLRHSIIANIPSVKSFYGEEFRSFFKTIPGWTMIGCDSSGNQARGLAFYLGDEEFIDQLLHGDIHTYNANLLTESLKQMGITFVVSREIAKRILYAFLFGASGGKLWSYIFGAADQQRGNILRQLFSKAVPGLETLLNRLESMFRSTKRGAYGYIRGIAGNRIYADSSHKLLVYLLQALEKATCSAALAMTMDMLEDEGIPYQPLIFYHDEIDFMVPDEYAKRGAEIGKLAFKEAPKLYGVNIMDGEAKIGQNWLEVH